MAVKWIGDAARELNMDVLLAVELLASKQNYPMNGLLDEDRVMLLKRYRVEATGKGTATHAAPRPATPPPPPPPMPADPGPGTEPISSVRAREAKAADATASRGKRSTKGDEPSSVTAPLSTQPQPGGDKSEERTVIIPPPGQGL